MIALEEKNFLSNKTDTSLYNGQPTDTGIKCHSVGVTFSTPSIPKNKDGVSVENVHTHSKQVCIESIIRKAKEIIDARNIENYAPMHYKQITKHGKKHIITEPLISPYTLRLCQMVVGKVVEPLWNNEWLRPELVTNIPYDSIVKGETLKKVTPVITFRKTRKYEESNN